MENILELQAARAVCERKMEEIVQTSILLGRRGKSDNKEKIQEVQKEASVWKTKMDNIDSKLYELVDKTF